VVLVSLPPVLEASVSTGIRHRCPSLPTVCPLFYLRVRLLRTSITYTISFWSPFVPIFHNNLSTSFSYPRTPSGFLFVPFWI
jgi:hypothetical protein